MKKINKKSIAIGMTLLILAFAVATPTAMATVEGAATTDAICPGGLVGQICAIVCSVYLFLVGGSCPL